MRAFRRHAQNLVKNLVPASVDTRDPRAGEWHASVEHDLLMPKYLYHAPLDYSVETYPPDYDAAIFVTGDPLPLPPPTVRPGYAPDDDKLYLEWGKHDHDWLMRIVSEHIGVKPGMSILDFGCSSGRVLRHFRAEYITHNWQLYGIEIQAYLVEWLRRNFPPEFQVICGSIQPHLPYADASMDVIFGISVFTHMKYLWDTWLTEFKRVLKPGGLCIQTVQTERAWSFYHEHRNEDWVKAGHPQSMLAKPVMDVSYFQYGDAFVSQNFFKADVIRNYWGRIMPVIDVLPPNPTYGYQDWIVLQRPHAT